MKNLAELQSIAKALNGIPIWGVLPGSASALAGVRSGDVVLKVNGLETPSFEHFLRARDLCKQRFDLEVYRDGAIMKLSVSLQLDESEPCATPRAFRAEQATSPS